MQLHEGAETVSGRMGSGNDRLGADLKILPRPDDAWLDRAGRYLSRTDIADGRRERDLDKRDQLVEGLPQADVFDAALQIRKTVLKGEAVVEIGRVRYAGALVLRGEIEPEIAGNRKRPRPRQRIR